MKIFIRADSSFLIGTGHIIRCLTLAQSLRNRGATVTFICRELDGNIISLVEEKQFKVIKLFTPKSPLESTDIYERNRGVSLDQEIGEMSEIVRLHKPTWIIVDHYSLSKEWEKTISDFGSKIFVIDDLFRNHHCHALLDQNAFGGEAKYRQLTSQTSDLFIGPQFALLAPNFLEIPHFERKFDSLKRILIFFGGSDNTGETLKTIKLLKRIEEFFEFDIVVGKTNVQLNAVIEFCSKNDKFQLHIQTTRMPQLMEKADLFLGAGGTVTWERCFLGLPAICISTADNQIQIAKDLDRMQVHKYLGHWDTINEQKLLDSIESLKANTKQQELYSKNSLSLAVASKAIKVIEYFN